MAVNTQIWGGFTLGLEASSQFHLAMLAKRCICLSKSGGNRIGSCYSCGTSMFGVCSGIGATNCSFSISYSYKAKYLGAALAADLAVLSSSRAETAIMELIWLIWLLSR